MCERGERPEVLRDERGDVVISAAGVDKMPHTFAQQVTVSAHHENRQLVVCHFYSAGNGQAAAMQSLKAIGIHKRAHVAGAPNAIDHHALVRFYS